MRGIGNKVQSRTGSEDREQVKEYPLEMDYNNHPRVLKRFYQEYEEEMG